MDTMLKIGEFSRLSQVTIKTLHHYDELGLLKPVHIDPFTNYRFYDVEQLPRLHRIMALKEMGLSLEQIGLMLEKELSTEEMRGMLRLQQAQIQQQVNEAQRQLAMVEFRLRMIEAESSFPDLDIVLKRIEPLRALSFFPGPHPHLANWNEAVQRMARVAGALNKAVADGVIQHTGINIDIFYGETILPFDSPELHERQHEILVGVTEAQTDVTVEGIGPMKIKEGPAVEKAATLMIANSGPFEIYEKFVLLRRWTVAHGYKPAPFVRQVAHRGPIHTLNFKEFVLEAQIPVAEGK
jgi:DNA-binding transcriptional MerR regulator